MNDTIFLAVGAVIIVVVIYLGARDYMAGGAGSSTEAEVEGSEPGSASLGASWRSFGVLSVVLGAAAVVFGIFMKTSVSAPSLYGSDEVVNLGLQQTQALVFIGGLFGVGLGVFCLAVGAILNAMSRQGSPKL